MKRFLLTAASLLAVTAGFSQSPGLVKLTPEQNRMKVEVPVAIFENQNPAAAQEVEDFGQGVIRSATETQIGQTYYDLQSNSAIQRRIIRHPNGTITATWTFSTDSEWTNRGTGYNFFNGTSWGAYPTVELETERTGWPNPLVTGQGREIIISHSTASNIFRQTQRNTVGSGTWSQTNLTSQSGQVWGRSAVGGTNNNTIHMIGMTLPSANGGTAYNGMDGAFLYTRSTNGGTSFDITDYQIPGTDINYFNGFDGDSYAIDADGNTVAIVVGGLGRGVQLFKSTNNGVTWTKTDVMVSDVWFEETATIVDTTLEDRLWTSDGAVSVLIDDNGMCHVWFGTMYIANADITDGTITYYPYTNSIQYWNEDFPGPHSLFLVGMLDMNGNGVLDIDNPGGQYRFSGLVSHPQAGIDEDGCMYLSYTGIREDLTSGSQNYRHTYVMKSCDNGCSWSFPIDVTGATNNDFVECAFPSIARHVDDEIHIVYMADNEPGIAVSGDADASTLNKIIYLKEDATRFDTTDICPTEIAGDTVMCIGGTVALHALGCASTYAWTGPSGFTSSNQSITASNFGTYTCTYTTTCGTATESVNVVQYSGTGGVDAILYATNMEMCPGDQSTISAQTNVGGLSYLWNTGATTQNITVTTPGTYTVTIADCNAGSTVETITIAQPTTAPAVVITGDLTICTGDVNTLSVIPVTGGQYLWSTGATTTSTTISAAGTYTCIIQNCAGTSQASVVVTTEAAPTASIDAPNTEACEGDALSVTASGGSTYEWSDGSTSPTLTINTPSESGTYTVTVMNDCGDEATADITLTIHPTPSAPSISYNGSSYVSSQTGAGTHTWYINGFPVAGQTGNTLPGAGIKQGDDITCTYTDENGCTSDESAILVGLSEANIMNAHIVVYPNPSNGAFDIRFTGISGVMSMTMYNALGQVVYNQRVQVSGDQVEHVESSAVQAGTYLIKITDEGTGASSVLPLIVE